MKTSPTLIHGLGFAGRLSGKDLGLSLPWAGGKASHVGGPGLPWETGGPLNPCKKQNGWPFRGHTNLNEEHIYGISVNKRPEGCSLAVLS